MARDLGHVMSGKSTGAACPVPGCPGTMADADLTMVRGSGSANGHAASARSANRASCCVLALPCVLGQTMHDEVVSAAAKADAAAPKATCPVCFGDVREDELFTVPCSAAKSDSPHRLCVSCCVDGLAAAMAPLHVTERRLLPCHDECVPKYLYTPEDVATMLRFRRLVVTQRMRREALLAGRGLTSQSLVGWRMCWSLPHPPRPQPAPSCQTICTVWSWCACGRLSPSKRPSATTRSWYGRSPASSLLRNFVVDGSNCLVLRVLSACQYVEYLETSTAMSEAKKAAEAEKHVNTAGGRNSLSTKLYKTPRRPHAPVSVKCPRPGCPHAVPVRSPFCRESCSCLCGKRFCSHCGHLPHFHVSCEDAMAVEMQWVQWLLRGREAYLTVRPWHALALATPHSVVSPHATTATPHPTPPHHPLRTGCPRRLKARLCHLVNAPLLCSVSH